MDDVVDRVPLVCIVSRAFCRRINIMGWPPWEITVYQGVQGFIVIDQRLHCSWRAGDFVGNDSGEWNVYSVLIM